MLSLASKTSSIVARCVCTSLLAVAAQPLFAASSREPREKSQPRWVSEAEELVGELLDLAPTIPEVKEPTDDLDRIKAIYSLFFAGPRLTKLRKADRILWRLWLTTGMPPLLKGPDESWRASLEKTGSAYRRYVAKHANLTEEELHRLGLTNTIESFGSPLWYMTMKYLTKKANLQFRPTIVIRVTPSHVLIRIPLSSDTYTRFSAALSSWLDANKERMIWDSRTKRFRPRDGTYVGTGELSRTIANEDRTPLFFRKLIERQAREGPGGPGEGTGSEREIDKSPKSK